jgi:methionyl-tRNA formyltransferase
LYRILVERLKDKRALKEIFTQKPYDYIEKKDVDVLEVNDINSEEVENFVRLKAPEVVLVSGTPLLKEPLIKSAQGKIINLHPGFAPQYRGRYGSFWPIYNREPHLVGATIHFIDKGIDTGNILVQQQVAFERNDTLKAITYKQQKLGVELLIKCLKNFDSLTTQAYHKDLCPSKNYYIPGLTHYIKAKMWLRSSGFDKETCNE